MSNKTFGIIGAGFVGSAVAKGFMLDGEVGLYDIDEYRRTASMEWVCNADYVFVCVPTPMRNVEGGYADLSIMDSVFKEIAETREKEEYRNENSIFIIKSTVPVGTTRKYSDAYNFPIVHCPEFLTERTANIDFLIPARHIIGGTNPSILSKVENLFAQRFPGISVLTMGPEEAELVKYMCNCFFATKVTFLNEMKLLSDKLGMNWEDVKDGFLSDGRISHSHTQVPGHDGDRGFGGKCVLPNAKLKTRYRIGCGLDDLEGAWKYQTIKELFDNQINRVDAWGVFEVESTNYSIDKVEYKDVLKVTKREVNEDIYAFETEEGVFECTGDHLIPVLRDGEKILISAKEIKETDELFCNK